MTRWLRTSAFAVALGWPLALHIAALGGHAAWMPAVTFVAACLGLAVAAAAAATRAALLTALLALAALALLLVYAPAALVFAPPIVLNAALAAWFAQTLRSGREPAIAVFARMEQGTLTPELVRYTRVFTWLWTLLFALLAATAAWLAAYGSLSAWSWFTNCATYVAIGGAFAGEYLYRRLRYPEYQHASLAVLLRNVRAGGAWRAGTRRR